MIRPSTTLHINLQPSFLLFKVLGCGKGATTATVNPQNCIPPFFTPLIFKSQVRSVPLRSSFFLPVSPPVINETQEFFFKHFPGIYKFSLLSVSFLGHKAFFFFFSFFSTVHTFTGNECEMRPKHVIRNESDGEAACL